MENKNIIYENVKKSIIKIIKSSFISFVVFLFFLNTNLVNAAISIRETGVYASDTASLTVTIPTSQVAGDMMILTVGTKPYSGTNTISGAAGWASLGSVTDGTVASGIDAGSMKTEVFYKIATSDTETNPVVDNTSNSISGGVVTVFQKASNEAWDTPVGAGGGDATAGTDFSVTASSDVGHTAGDMLVGYAPIRSDAGTQSSITITAAGLTVGTFTESPATDLATSSGQDMAMSGGYVLASSGTSSAAPVYASTLAASHTGSAYITRLRVVPATNLGNGTDGSSSTIGPEASATEIDRFSLVTSSGTDTVTGMTVTLAGNASAYTNIATVDVQTTGGVSKCSLSPTSNTVNLTSCAIAVTNSLTEYKILITPKSHVNMPAVPGASYATTATVTSITSTNPASGADSGSATITVDNASPAAVTSSTATGGDTVVNLAWTNPADSDFTTGGTVVVLRRQDSAVADVPVEGTTYTVGNTIGTATVVCVVAGSPPTTTCQDTNVTNNNVYHYSIFTKDSRGNYNTGTVPTGSPVTPSVPGITISSTTIPGLDPCTGSPNFVATTSSCSVLSNSIGTLLNAGTNVSFTSPGNITVSSAVTKASGANNPTISFYTDENIIVNADISTATGTLPMLFNADCDANSSGYINISGNLTSLGGNITLGGGSGTISNGTGFAVGNAWQASGIYVNNKTIAAGGGNIIANGQGYNTTTGSNHGINITNSSITTIGNGTININGNAKGTSSGLNNGLSLSSGVISTINGNLTVNATGGGEGGASSNFGVYIGSLSTIETTGSGNLSVTGMGGNPSGTGSGYQYGIYCTVANCIQTTGTGTLSVTGTGGGTSGGNVDSYGVYLNNGSITGNGGAMTINGTGGANSGNFNHGVYVYGASAAISNTGSGTLSITGTGGGITNSGSDYGLYVVSGGVISTVDGNLTVNNSTGGGAGSGANNHGVYITGTNSTIKTTGSGNLSVTGTGGSPNGTGTSNHGVNCATANCIQTTGTGTISITGTGGNALGSGGANYGISNTGSITGASGSNISIIGIGGGGSSNANVGIYIGGGSVTTLGVGTLTISGTGGSAGSYQNPGFWINTGLISSVDGLLTITGTGGGTNNSQNRGLYIQGVGANIKTTGSGNLVVTGIPHSGGIGTSNYGIDIATTNALQTTGSGNITVNTDTLYLTEAGDINSIGSLTIAPYTAAETVGLAGGAGTLALTSTYLGYLTYGTGLTIGNTSQTGTTTVGAYASWAKPITFAHNATGSINITGAQTNSSSFNFNGPTTLSADITALNLTISSGTFNAGAQNINLSGTTGTLFTKGAGTFTNGTSTVNLTGTSLTPTVASGTPSFYNLTVNGALGTPTLGEALTVTNALTITAGNLTTVNNTVSAKTLTLNGGTYTPGSSTTTITGTGTAFNYSSGTYTAGTSTLKFTDSSNTGITFAGGSQTYGNIYFNRGGSTAANTITDSNTFADFKDDGTVAHSILFTTGTTQTVSSWNVSGSTGNLITLNSTDTGTHNLVMANGGYADSDYLNIQHSVVTPASTWYAGDNSVNNQAVATAGSGWTFTARLAVRTYELSGFRLFNNIDNTDIGTPLSSANTLATLNNSGDVFRLRALLHVGGSSLPINSQNFKLQYAQMSSSCDVSFSGETYSDITSDTDIAYYNNFYPEDKVVLTTNANDPTHNSDTIVNQSYVESNNFTNSIAEVPLNQDGKWDFSLYDKSVSNSVSYCLRIVKSDGSLLNTYSFIPEIITAFYRSRGGSGGGVESSATPNASIDSGTSQGGGDGNTVLPKCSDTIDNDGDTLIDTLDPNCHAGDDLGNPYLPNYDSEASVVAPCTVNCSGGGSSGDLGYNRTIFKSIFNISKFKSLKDSLLGLVFNPHRAQ